MVALKINWDIFKYCLAQCLAYDKHATDKAKGTKESHILFLSGTKMPNPSNAQVSMAFIESLSSVHHEAKKVNL